MTLRCPCCNKRGLSIIGTVFMIHDEIVICQRCGVGLSIPKARKSLIIGIEYIALLISVAASIAFHSLWPSVVALLLIMGVRLVVLPKIAVEKKREINRLRKYRRK